MNRPGAARRVLRRLARPGQCPDAMLPDVAMLFGRVARPRMAARVWNRLRRRHPGRADLHFRFAIALREAGIEPERLLAPLNEAALLAPREPTYRIALADTWVLLGSPCDAAEVLADVDPANVGCPGCLRRMADIFLDVGDRDSAAVCEFQRHRLNPTFHCPDPN